MKVLIDIPDSTYKKICYLGSVQDRYAIGQAIFRGVCIPEHHGRLVDADEILSTHKEGNWDLHKVLTNAKTIVEGAD